MKRKRKFTAVVLMTLLLTLLVGLRSYAAQEDKIFEINCFDSKGNLILTMPAFVIGEGSGKIVLTDSCYLSDDFEVYVLTEFGGDDGYELDSQYVEVPGYGLAMFLFAGDEPDDSAAAGVRCAVRGESLNAVYVDGNTSACSTVFRLTDAQEANTEGELDVTLLYGTLASDIPEYYPPIALIDDSGCIIGVYTTEAKDFFTLWFDEEYFNSGEAETESQTEPAETKTGGSGRTEPAESETERAGRTDPTESGGGDDPSPGVPISRNVIGVLAAVGIVILIFLGILVIRSKKKKQPGYSASASAGNFQIKIEAISGEMAGRRFSVGKEGVTFGRDNGAGIRFSEGAKGVSRQHCRILWDEQGRALLMDCGSTYGTVIKGYGRLNPQTPMPIQSGDVFCLGSENNSFRVC